MRCLASVVLRKTKALTKRKVFASYERKCCARVTTLFSRDHYFLKYLFYLFVYRFWTWVEWITTSVAQITRRGDGEQEEGVEAGDLVVATAATAAKEETTTSSQAIRIAGDCNTECVRQAAVFTACVPADTRLGSITKLTLYCSPNDKRREFIDQEDEFLLEEESAWELLKLGDMAYVFLSGDVIRPVNDKHLKNLFVR